VCVCVFFSFSERFKVLCNVLVRLLHMVHDPSCVKLLLGRGI
jgi:hypothetical protein